VERETPRLECAYINYTEASRVLKEDFSRKDAEGAKKIANFFAPFASLREKLIGTR